MHDQDAIIRPFELPSLTTLRLYKPSPDHIRQASLALGFELAGPPNAFSAGSPRTARLASAEWLVTQGPSVPEIAARLAGILHHANDIRPGKLGWILSGTRAADILARDCTLDLHPAAFIPRSVTRTLVAQVPVILERIDNKSFSLIADRSLEDYLKGWFANGLEAW
ncbi:MAG: hypothetical protein KJS87_08660 [Alphaproteobacteria bacterium]|nr:hypothetical protein [Alphaproteobacteria bacterium]